MRDSTAPLVGYSGNAGTYGASEEVAITCSASDALSGLAAADCTDVTGPAWGFGVGAHTFDATATDHAGNGAAASTTFTVVVGVDDLITLVEAWVTGPGANGVRNSLIAKLTAGRNAPNVKAFVKEVQAQSGHRLTAEQAATLVALARAL